ncbi:uncharacterized protein LOC114479654 [Gouania willdenowi]|uniref:uncharacterized protein LOC114479654 n=1 Tax=Gouania willdenowi TaxID=441366 RepID=UPI0010553059|nr:uncharacterized protein LOC114479654 [Gouania willdenowi]
MSHSAMQNQDSGPSGAEASSSLRTGQIMISATQVHKILNSGFMKGKSSTIPHSYIITDKPNQIKPLEWGNIMEAKARMKYQEWKMNSRGQNVSISMSGLYDDPKWPWLCAKTDGMVMDDSGNFLCCLEVKCPYKHRHKRVVDACREDRRFCLEILDPDTQPPKYQLKKSHEYFTQVQAQMALTGIHEVDFVVYTLKDMAITNVKFDSEHWEETVAKLQTFIEIYTFKRSEEEF